MGKKSRAREYHQCALCGKLEYIEEAVATKRGQIVRLHCQHVQTIYAKEEDMQEEQRMLQHTCRCCQTQFITYLEGAVGEFCHTCRESLLIKTEDDAEGVIQMFDLGVLVPDEHLRARNDPKKPSKALATVPKVDPAVVLEGIRAMTDHQVAPATYTKPVTYVTAKNGLFEVRNSDIATVVTKATEVQGVTTAMTEGITLNLPKIPFDLLIQTISFFRGVCERQKGASEAIVQIWWDRETKQHVLHVPPQQVQSAHVHHDSVFDHEGSGQWIHVADIHSHGGMGAFWSGGDDHDEKRITIERLFGVIGKVVQPIPEWRWRMRTKDKFIDLDIADIFTMPEQEYSFVVKAETLFRSMGNAATFKDGLVSLWCPVDPFVSVEVPEAWYEQVKGWSWAGQGQKRFPGFAGQDKPIKGYIWIAGVEYHVENKKLVKTGQTLLKYEGHDHGNT